MRVLQSLTPALALLASCAQAASSWSFADGTVSVVSKANGDSKEQLSPTSPLKNAVNLGPRDTIKIALTTKESGKDKRPHQAFVVLRETATGLEVPFPLKLKDNGKGVVEISQKDLPIQHRIASESLSARLLVGSFGAVQALESDLFKIRVETDDDDHLAKSYEAPLRYGKREQIFHQYRAGSTNPPKIISVVFTFAVLATIPVLLISWLALGANLNHATKALGAAPLSHTIFFGSLVAMEGVLFAYYASWRLYQVLPAAGIVSVVAFLSGKNALGEVQGRRLAGER